MTLIVAPEAVAIALPLLLLARDLRRTAQGRRCLEKRKAETEERAAGRKAWR